MRSEMCSLHLTHPSVHTWSSGQPTVQRPGSSRGLPVGAGIQFKLHLNHLNGIHLNLIQKRRCFLWAKANLKWTVAKWKIVLWSDKSKFEVLLENWDAMSSGLKRTRTTQVVISAQFRSLHLWWYGVAWVRVTWAAYTSGKAPSMLKGISNF